MGSTRVVLNEANNWVSSYDFMPFGGIMRSTVNTDISYQFTGQEYDPETGLHNFRARFYDSDLAMFFAVDPAGQGFSPFAYAGNNPVLNIDRNGKWFWAAAQVAFDIYQAYTIATATYNVVQAISNGDIGGITQGIISTGANLLVGGAAQSVTGLGGFAGGVISGGAGTGASNFVVGAPLTDNLLQNALFSGVSNYVSNMSLTESAQSALPGGQKGFMSDSQMHEVAKADFNKEIGKNGLTKLTGKVPKGYLSTPEGGFTKDLNWIQSLYTENGEYSGLTVRIPTGNEKSYNSEVYISAWAQGNSGHFHMTLGHELIHVQQNFKGLFNPRYMEVAAYEWEYNEAPKIFGDQKIVNSYRNRFIDGYLKYSKGNEYKHYYKFGGF